jgi:hypothetical protein
VPPCGTHQGDFYESMRPSTRWALLTRLLFAIRDGLGRQTQGASPSRGEF